MVAGESSGAHKGWIDLDEAAVDGADDVHPKGRVRVTLTLYQL